MGKKRKAPGGIGNPGAGGYNQQQNQGGNQHNFQTPGMQPYGGGYNNGAGGGQAYGNQYSNKPYQVPLSGTQRGNLRQQVIFQVGDPQSAFGSSSDTPCTMFVSLKDISLTSEQVIAEFMQPSQEIPHVDRVSRLQSVGNHLVFGMSARDALATLQTKHSDGLSNSPIYVSLNRYAGPQPAPSVLTPPQVQALYPYIESSGINVADFSMLPLKEHENLPWSFEQPNYFSAVVSALLTPIFVSVTFLRLSHLAITRIDALAPLAKVLEGLDLSYNNIGNVQKDCVVLRDFSRLKEVKLLGNPCTDDAEYYNKLNSMNRMITMIDNVSMSSLAVFRTLPPVPVIDAAYSPTQDDPIVDFILQFLNHFDSDRQPGSSGILTSAYAHDASFSLHYMARGAVNPDFAPISLRRNVGMLLSALPPSLHELDTLTIDDVVPVFGNVLRLVQFTVECVWSAAHRTRYKRTLLLSGHAQKPWNLTVLNDQMQLQVDWNEYSYVFANVLNSANGNLGAQIVQGQNTGSIRASAVNVTRQWNRNPQGNQRGGFQQQQQRNNRQQNRGQQQQGQQGQGNQQRGQQQQNQGNQKQNSQGNQQQGNQQGNQQQGNQQQGNQQKRGGGGGGRGGGGGNMQSPQGQGGRAQQRGGRGGFQGGGGRGGRQ